MEDNILQQKAFPKSDSKDVAAEAADLVRKVKKHIEEDKCTCCAEALR